MLEMLRCVVDDSDLNSTQHTHTISTKSTRNDKKRPRTTQIGRNPSQNKISEKTVRESMNVKNRIKELSC